MGAEKEHMKASRSEKGRSSSPRATHHRETLVVSPDEQTVVLTGAGFSRGLGIPLQDELVKLVVGEEILRLHNLSLRRDPDYRVGIEEFLTSMDFEETLGSGKSPWSSESLASAIALQIVESFLSFLSNDSFEVAVERVATNVRALLGSSSAWITLNWDTLPEMICRANDQTFSYLGESDGFPLLKLHGSIDWFKRVKKTKPYIREPAFVPIFGNYHRYGLFGDLRNLLKNPELLSDEISELYKTCHPIFIPPTQFKSYADPLIRKIWKRAWREMWDMDHLVIVGYSFPHGDLSFRMLLMRMICKPSYRRPPRVSIVNPDPDGGVAKRFAPFCVGPVTFIRSRFEDIEIAVRSQ
jgi:hypothetical protein